MRFKPSARLQAIASVAAAGVIIAIVLLAMSSGFMTTGTPIAHTVQATAPSGFGPLPTGFATMSPAATPAAHSTPVPGNYPTPAPIAPGKTPHPYPTRTPHPKPTPTATAPAPTDVPPTATSVPPTATPTMEPTVTPTPPPDPFVDPMNDLTLVSGYTTASDGTPASYFDTTNPDFFGGDLSRLVRKVGYTEVSVQYTTPGARSVTVWDTEAMRGQVDGQMYQPLVIEESSDGVNWASVGYSVPAPVPYPGFWQGYTLSVALDAGTNYVRVGWTADDTASLTADSNWTSQIDQIEIDF